jgi:hypothetical protein
MVGRMVIMAMCVGCIVICVVNMDGDIRGWIHLITLVWIVTYHIIMEDKFDFNICIGLVI